MKTDTFYKIRKYYLCLIVVYAILREIVPLNFLISSSFVSLGILLLGGLVAFSSRYMSFTKVDFPAPLGPTTYTNSPCFISTDIPFDATTPFGYFLITFFPLPFYFKFDTIIH